MLDFNIVYNALLTITNGEKPISVNNDGKLIIFDNGSPNTYILHNLGYKIGTKYVNCFDFNNKRIEISLWRIFIPIKIFQHAVNNYVTVIVPITVGDLALLCDSEISSDTQWWFSKFMSKDEIKKLTVFDQNNPYSSKKILYLGNEVYPQSLLIADDVLHNRLKYHILADGSWYYEFSYKLSLNDTNPNSNINVFIKL